MIGEAYAKGAMPYEPPTHTVERSLRATTGAKIIAGVDEVGRGAWAGPVTVCAAITGLRRPPEGLTDSKLLTVKRRTFLAEVLEQWVTSYALGHASPEEIDDLGMTAALRLAAVRALETLPVRPDAANSYVIDAIPAMMMYRSKMCGSEWGDRDLEEMIDQMMVPLLGVRVG